jgi:predicted nucleotidyltransferase component of viral defense system
MLLDNLKQTVESGKNITKPLYLRNLLKEELQNYVLQFIYNNVTYRDLIFTGGTCLRKIYGLPRLSEDLDFDFTGKFDVNKFADAVKVHFKSDLQYPVETKISGKENTVYIKLPIMKSLGFKNEEVLFIRCDFSEEALGEYGVETNTVSTKDFTFFVRNYDLSTLFANKIYAFLSRGFYKGGQQTVPFKARDIFDLVWFLERAKKSSIDFSPNWKRLEKAFPGVSRKGLATKIIEKAEKINESEIKQDLEPFIESSQSVDDFSKAFKGIIKRGFEGFK